MSKLIVQGETINGENGVASTIAVNDTNSIAGGGVKSAQEMFDAVGESSYTDYAPVISGMTGTFRINRRGKTIQFYISLAFPSDLTGAESGVLFAEGLPAPLSTYMIFPIRNVGVSGYPEIGTLWVNRTTQRMVIYGITENLKGKNFYCSGIYESV